MDVQLENNLLLLRNLKLSDADNMVKNIHKDVYENTICIPWPYKKNDAIEYIKKSRKRFKNNTRFTFGIILKENNELIGKISISVDLTHKTSCIGYWIGKDHKRNGYMKQSIEMILKFGFQKLKMNRIEAYVFTHNKASYKLLEKCDFKLEGIKRDAFKKKNKYIDAYQYSILKKDYNKSSKTRKLSNKIKRKMIQ